MNTKFLSALTATAAATAMFGAAAPAHAFSFGTNAIQFEKDTQVIFNFRQSFGAFQSSLGVYSVNNGSLTFLQTLLREVKPSDSGASDNFKGTLGNTVLGSGIATFNFMANQVYTLGLSSRGRGIVYSTSALNAGQQQAVFFNPNGMLPTIIEAPDTKPFAGGNAGNFTSGNTLFNGGTAISFDDGGNVNDKDFQDFTVTAEAVPEPMTMTGLALGLGGLVAARRRRRGSNTAS